MLNGLLILAAFLLYGLFVYGPEVARFIGRKRKIIGETYKMPERSDYPECLLHDTPTLREVNARRGK